MGEAVWPSNCVDSLNGAWLVCW